VKSLRCEADVVVEVEEELDCFLAKRAVDVVSEH
jgi:hypothetical protein